MLSMNIFNNEVRFQKYPESLPVHQSDSYVPIILVNNNIINKQCKQNKFLDQKLHFHSMAIVRRGSTRPLIVTRHTNRT